MEDKLDEVINLLQENF